MPVIPVPRKCGHTKPDGSPCRAVPSPNRRFCTFHDPDFAAEFEEGRRQGGRTRMEGVRAVALPANAPDLPLKSVADVTAALAEAYNAVRTGRMDARLGNCLGVLAGVILRALEGGELERRVAELEAGRPGVKR